MTTINDSNGASDDMSRMVLNDLIELNKILREGDGRCSIILHTYGEWNYGRLFEYVKGLPVPYELSRPMLPLDDPLSGRRESEIKYTNIDPEDASLVAMVVVQGVIVEKIPAEMTVTYSRSKGELLNIRYNAFSRWINGIFEAEWKRPKIEVEQSAEVAPMRFNSIAPIYVPEEKNPVKAVVENLTPMIDLLSKLIEGDEKVKGLARVERYQGSKVSRPENVMEHIGRVALIARMLSDYLNEIGVKNDRAKVLDRALFHDITEGALGDIIYPKKYMGGEESKRLMEKLRGDERDAGRELLGGVVYPWLFHEYFGIATADSGDSMEDSIAKLADIIDVQIYSGPNGGLADRSEASTINARSRERITEQVGKIVGLQEAQRKSKSFA